MVLLVLIILHNRITVRGEIFPLPAKADLPLTEYLAIPKVLIRGKSLEPEYPLSHEDEVVLVGNALLADTRPGKTTKFRPSQK